VWGVWGALAIVFQIIRTAGFDSYFRHFTGWVWTLQAIFFFVVWAADPNSRTGEINTVFFLPLVFVQVWFVFIAISFLAPWNVDLIRVSLIEYGEATVGGVNFVLHYLPWLVLMGYMLLEENYLRQQIHAFVKGYKENNKRDTFILIIATFPVCFTLSYFFWFDASREYGIHGMPEWAGLLISAGIVLVLTFVYWLWFWPWVVLPRRSRAKSP